VIGARTVRRTASLSPTARRPLGITKPRAMGNLSRHYSREHYQRPLRERWNIAMTDAGFVGSEFIDEPERIGEEIKRLRKQLHDLRMKGRLS